MIERLIWLLPALVAALGLWRPRAGLIALMAVLPMFGSPPGGPYLQALEVAGLAAILTGMRAGRPERSRLGWPAAAFVAVSLLTLVPSPYLPPSWRPADLLGLLAALPEVESWTALFAWRAALDLLLGWGLFVTVRSAFAGRSVRPLGLALAAGLAAVTALGLAARTGLIDLAAYRPLQSGPDRMQSVFFLSGWLAEYLVIATPVALAGLEMRGDWRRWLRLPLLALAIACGGLTLQRGAWAAAGVQAAAWLLLVAPRWRRSPAVARRAIWRSLAVVALAAAVWVGTGAVEALLQRGRSVESGLRTRSVLWRGALEIARERPLMGSGLGTFTAAYDRLHPRGSPGAPPFRETAHNLYLHVVAERGLLGLATLAVLGWAAVVCLRRPRAGMEAWALGIGLSLVGVAVYGLVQYMIHLRSLQWLCWILLGCLALVTAAEPRAPAGRRARLLGALAVLALLAARLIWVPPPSYPGNRGFGFHDAEPHPAGEFRWTRGSAAQRLRWRGSTLVLSLANGHPRAAERPVAVTVGVDGATLARVTIPGGWEEHRFELGAPRREWIVLTLDAEPTFRPFRDYLSYPELKRSGDIRCLGIAVKDIHWE